MHFYGYLLSRPDLIEYLPRILGSLAELVAVWPIMWDLAFLGIAYQGPEVAAVGGNEGVIRDGSTRTVDRDLGEYQNKLVHGN